MSRQEKVSIFWKGTKVLCLTPSFPSFISYSLQELTRVFLHAGICDWLLSKVSLSQYLLVVLPVPNNNIAETQHGNGLAACYASCL